MSQYPLTLPLETVYTRENFVVSSCNDTAFRWIEKWPGWPANALLLFGPAGSGKTHLAHIWAAKSDARKITSDHIEEQLAGPLTHPIFVENIDRLTQEIALLQLINICKEDMRPLLLTSSIAPAALPFALPDLTSRLLALPAAEILPPDDEALSAVLRKQFSDRQLKIDDEVILYLLARMPRSFAGALELAGELDRKALAAKKPITIPFVREIMADYLAF